MLKVRHSWTVRYGIAAFASLAALALTHIFWDYIQPGLYPFFLAAVMLSSWVGGFGPGLASALLGAFFSEYFFLTPVESISVSWANWGRTLYFMSVAVLICTLNARLHYAQRRAEANAAEAQYNQALLLKNQETLRQSEERFRLLVEGVTDYAIFLLSPQGQIVSWTIGAERILGYREAEAIGQPFSILFTEEAIQQGLPNKVLAVAADQGFAKENRWHIRKDKTSFWAQCVVTALRDEAGNLQGFSKIMQDITARKKAEEERSQLLKREQLARQEAESANRAKDEFLAILSHELRTPLTALTGWVGMLRSGRLDEDRVSLALETIERNATLQMQLVEDLLDISRIIRGDLWLDSQPVNVAQVIQEAIEIVQPQVEEKLIRFALEIASPDRDTFHQQGRQSGSAEILVLGDAERLQQVVLNLLSNAIKFTPEQGEITVDLSVVQRQALHSQLSDLDGIRSTDAVSDVSENVQLQVKDTGIGISAEFLPHVFDRFRQADSTNTRAYKGLGLGLAIAHYLVERQGGTLQADSPGVGQGSTFTVTLPLLKLAEARRSPVTARLSHLAEFRPELRVNGLSVLIVDDEADTRIWLKNVFEMQQAKAIAVGSVDEAVAQLGRHSPDIVISDIAMPEKDGYALIEELKRYEQQSQRAIPAIALTAHASLEDVEKALTAGFWQHLAKPIKAEELMAVVVRLLEQQTAAPGNKA